MKVRDIISDLPYICSPDQTIDEVINAFFINKIEEAPVVNPDTSLAGFIGKKQLHKAIDEQMGFDTPIEKVMLRDVLSVSPDFDLDEISIVPARSLPVTEKGKLVGVISHEHLNQYIQAEHITSLPQMAAIIDAMPDGIMVLDANTKIVYFNQAAERLLEMPGEILLGKPYQDIFPHGRLHKALDGKRGISSRKISFRGKVHLSISTPIRKDDRVIGALEIMQDISHLEDISHELEYTKKLKAEMDDIIEASFDSIFVTDAKGYVLSINDAYTRITGIKAADIIGKNMYELVEQGLYDRSATIVVIETHKPVTFTQKIKTGKTLLVTGNPIFNEHGQLVRVLTNGRDITELNRLKQEVEQAYSLSKLYEEELKRAVESRELVINSEKTKELFDLIIRVSKVDSTVLVYGESGVGKELVMKELHKNSPRREKPFLSINCAAIPESLLESELFGYEGGAFSGARKEGKMGIFELANGGTLCLDEIGELPLNLQAKLLRVIQEEEITRIGGTSSMSIDVRIIAATNRDLWEMVTKRQFREDLYYRLNVVPIYVSPLRERKEEIPALVFHFLKMFNEKYGMNKVLDQRLVAMLMDYDWPGNVRELKNVIERAVVTSNDSVIRTIKLAGSINEGYHPGQPEKIEDAPGTSFKEKVSLFEKQLLQEYIDIYRSSRKVAHALGVSQTLVIRKAAKYGIPLPLGEKMNPAVR